MIGFWHGAIGHEGSPDGGLDGGEELLAIFKAHFCFCGMDVDIYFIGIDFDKENGNGIAIDHEHGMIGIGDSCGKGTIVYVATVNEKDDVFAGTAGNYLGG